METKTIKSVNYTPAMVEDMIAVYQEAPTSDTVEALAKQYDKTTRSIIAKLSAEGVYVKQDRVGKTKTGADVIKKSDLVAQITEALGGLDIPSLEKATKPDLMSLLKAITGNTATSVNS